MKAYKVVTRTMRSISVTNRFAITYPVGRKVKASVPNSGIFVFKSQRSAESFAGDYPHAQVWECEVPSLKHLNWRTEYTSFKEMLAFWEAKVVKGRINLYDDKYSTYGVPRGTYTAPWVKLLKKVN